MQPGDRSAGHSKINPSLVQRPRSEAPLLFTEASAPSHHLHKRMPHSGPAQEVAAALCLSPCATTAVLAHMGEQRTSTHLIAKASINPHLDQTLASAALRYPSPVSDDGCVIATTTTTTTHTTTFLAPGRLPPKLSREPARKYAYVDSLVDMATLFVESLWPLRGDAAACHAKRAELNAFLTTTIRVSKTSLSTMQLTLFYCLRLCRDQQSPSAMQLPAADRCPCPRLNFLSALILASKYLQDRNFSNRAWSKISGVPIDLLNLRERQFLRIVGWNLTLSQQGFQLWAQYLERFVTDVRDNLLFGDILLCRERWQFVVEKQLVPAAEADLTHVIAVCGSPLAGPQLTVCAEKAASATPMRSYSAPVLLTTPPLHWTTETIAATLEDHVVAAGNLSTCPFFDEFVKTTPKDSPLVLCGHPCTVSSAIKEDTVQQCPLTPVSLQNDGDSPAGSILLEETGDDEETYCLVTRVCDKRRRSEDEALPVTVKRARLSHLESLYS
ncbi:hypothetical protein BCR37DRAFT_377790 [Protomyces lactucae-debilis]|uniref:Cyclin-domain-containing protein n=1 Tax=Protomyces lactucae-debilis TaxID=2754530 RepID=A0A1Y2FNW5_PROLT|nr:uncharacterized protein BCR37DRAFT_377790 [Protomyces lactucae-debilis]ORY84906.1 hypothetical protein BCR37DRAFT_377790 [Protomyces lactucae-debilis]